MPVLNHDEIDVTTASKDALGFALLAAREEVRDLRVKVTELEAVIRAHEQANAVARMLDQSFGLYPVRGGA